MAKKKSKRQILIRKAKAATILRKRIAKKDFWAFCLYYDPKFFSKRLFLKRSQKRSCVCMNHILPV